jgi:hypothetical protein
MRLPALRTVPIELRKRRLRPAGRSSYQLLGAHPPAGGGQPYSASCIKSMVEGPIPALANVTAEGPENLRANVVDVRSTGGGSSVRDV